MATDYVFIGDDFTGASDTLATLAEAGLRVRLFLDAPDPRTIEAECLDAIGVATDLRARSPEEIATRLEEVAAAIAALSPRFVHYKVCSTFDSAPQIGNIGIAVLTLENKLQPVITVVFGGQPSLGRFCLFGNLFARGPDGKIHRLDRHPVMSRHPVTPMGEADLRILLAAQGLGDLVLISRSDGQSAGSRLRDLLARDNSRVLADAVDQSDIEALGLELRALKTSAKPVLLVGSSGVAEAITGPLPARQEPKGAGSSAVEGPCLVIAGSRSSATKAQIEAATLFDREPLTGADLYRSGSRHFAMRCAAALECGTNVLVHLQPGEDYGVPAGELSLRLADLAAAIVELRSVSRIAVAGGDTSSAVVRRLGFESLSFEKRAGAGVAICRGHATGTMDGARLLLKGGQVGALDIFDHFAR